MYKVSQHRRRCSSWSSQGEEWEAEHPIDRHRRLQSQIEHKQRREQVIELGKPRATRPSMQVPKSDSKMTRVLRCVVISMVVFLCVGICALAVWSYYKTHYPATEATGNQFSYPYIAPPANVTPMRPIQSPAHSPTGPAAVKNTEGGRLVTVRDGTKLFVQSKGQRKNGRIIFLEPELGMQSAYWGHYMNLLCKETEVCCYDRPGMSHSEQIQKEITLSKTADNIQDILMHLRPKSVIFFGHGMGDIFLRTWMHKYGHLSTAPKVEALVSVNGTATHDVFSLQANNSGHTTSLSEADWKKMERKYRMMGSTMKMFSGMGNTKIGRAILKPGLKSYAEGFDVKRFGGKTTGKGLTRTGRELRKLKKLRLEWQSLSVRVRPLRQGKQARNIPVLFLSSDAFDVKPAERELYALWQLDRSEYGKLRPDPKYKSYWRVAMKDATHVGILTQPEHASQAVKFYRQWIQHLASPKKKH